MNYIPTYIYLCIFLVLFIACFIRFLKDQFSPIKTEKAVVVHKQTVDHLSQFRRKGKRTKYAVTFLAGQKKLSFYVSEFSYHGYKVNETGMLTYKGSRIIDFSLDYLGE